MQALWSGSRVSHNIRIAAYVWIEVNPLANVCALHVLRWRQPVGRDKALVEEGFMELGQPSTGVVPLLTRYLPSASPATSPPRTRALQILADVAQGLMHMHGLDPPLIHRDVKSPNRLLTASLPDARARLADLGCTKVLHAKTTPF